MDQEEAYKGKMLYDYEAQKDTELTVNAGEVRLYYLYGIAYVHYSTLQRKVCEVIRVASGILRIAHTFFGPNINSVHLLFRSRLLP